MSIPVQYHGSLDAFHGTYDAAPDPHFAGRFQLVPIEHDLVLRNGGKVLSNVRVTSFTPLEMPQVGNFWD